MKINYVCKQCQKPFKDYASNGVRIFCSRKCQHEWEYNNLVANKRYNWKPKKYCVDCGKVLSRRKYTRCIECSSKVYGKESHHFIHGLSDTRGYKSVCDSRARAKRLGGGGSHTETEWLRLKQLYGFMCLCCKRTEPIVRLTEDHIIPLSRGGTDDISNIQPLCLDCNKRKFTKTLDFRMEVQSL